MRFHIFDLDGTLIDSRHRYKMLENGDIDLASWRENSTPEMIAKDKVMPLAEKMRRFYYSGDQVIICTSRVMSDADFQFLDDNKLFSDAILFRPDGCNDGCADLKEYMLDEFFEGIGTCMEDETVILYEDHMGVIERLRGRVSLCCVEGYRD